MQAYYKRAFDEVVGPRYQSSAPPPGVTRERYARQHAAVEYLTDHFHEAPVWIVACIDEGTATPTRWSGASIYPAVQNMLLAARALGLGATLTTRHLLYEKESEAAFGLPPGVHSYAILPIGYPMGRLAPWAVVRSATSCTRTAGASPIEGSSATPPRNPGKELVMPRLAPVTGKPDVPAEHHAVVDAVTEVFGGVRGPFSMLLHSPKLAERVLGLVTFFRDESVVEGKLRSIAILTAVREREAAYVWAAQVAAARRNGLREEVIDLLRAKGDPGRLADDEREIVTYVRQLMRTNRADQSAFDALQKRHGAQWLVELTAAANYFALLSGVVNAFEVAPPPDGDKLPT